MQFWKWRIRFVFGDFDVNITVPADHVMEATGELIEAKFYAGTSERYELAQKSFDKPVVIVRLRRKPVKRFSDKRKHGI
jgi:hypothetical protein